MPRIAACDSSVVWKLYGSSKYEHIITELASPSGTCIDLDSVARPYLAQNELRAREDNNPGG